MWCRRPIKCPTCDDFGVVDSGGVNPDMSPIMLPCPDCPPCDCEEVKALKHLLEKVQAALDSYGKVPSEVWIGSNSTADKVQWLVNRCIGADATISRLHKENAVTKWLQDGKYRTIIHRHDGTFRLVNNAMNIHADGDSLELIVNCEYWPKFRDCTERAP
jgi:hypothetical protein